MAQVDHVMEEYRRRSTALLDALNEVHDVLAVVEGTGADDTARAAFFDAFYTEFPSYDLPKSDLFASVVKWRELRTFIQTAATYVPLNKTRLR